MPCRKCTNSIFITGKVQLAAALLPLLTGSVAESKVRTISARDFAVFYAMSDIDPCANDLNGLGSDKLCLYCVCTLLRNYNWCDTLYVSYRFVLHEIHECTRLTC